MTNLDTLNVRYRIEFTCWKYSYDEPDVPGARPILRHRGYRH